MLELDERLRNAFDAPAPVTRAEVLERARVAAGGARSGRRVQTSLGIGRRVRVASVAVLCVVVLAGSLVLAATRPGAQHRAGSTGGKSTVVVTTSGPGLVRQPKVQVRITLDRTSVVRGTPIRGWAYLRNTTHKTVLVESCASDGWLFVGLSDSRIHYSAVVSSVACAPSVKLPPGVTRLPVVVSTRYQGCVMKKDQRGDPVCVVLGPPALPAGHYTTTLEVIGLPKGWQHPTPTRVTLLPEPPRG